jgi:hypothetical protein
VLRLSRLITAQLSVSLLVVDRGITRSNTKNQKGELTEGPPRRDKLESDMWRMKARNWLIGGMTCISIACIFAVLITLPPSSPPDSANPSDIETRIAFTYWAAALFYGGFTTLAIGLVLVITQKRSSSHPRLHRWHRVMAAVALVGLSWIWIGSSIQTFTGDALFWLGYQKPSHYGFNKLEQLLKTNRWQEADELTTWMIRKTSGTLRESRFSPTLMSFSRLPCADFQALDHLWVKYSNSRFGFSIQRQIYESIDGIANPINLPSNDLLDPKLDRFLTKVGRANPKFSLDDPVGTLPSSGIWLNAPFGAIGISSIGESAKRQKWCGL